MERTVLVAGLRRFFGILLGVALLIGAISFVAGALAGADLSRSLALGYYLAGSVLLLGGFFVGNRGPVRAKRNQPYPIFGTRFVRWATADELDETINTSAVYVSLGFALILVGVLADSI
jgi:hypothetical protein